MQALKAVSLIEKDVNNDLISWFFPSVEPAMDAVLKARCGLDSKELASDFRYSRFSNLWQYFSIATVDNLETQGKVVAISVCVLSEEFNPAKYETLLKIFVDLYLEGGGNSPIPIMKAYLTVFTRGSLKTPHGAFDDSSFDNRKALVSSVKKIFTIYGMESIIIWVAMLTKKRIFVYHDKVSELLPVIRSFPLMGCWHRQNWTLLRPFMTLADGEMEELKSSGVYVAGFTDPSCQQRTKDYDLFIDLSAQSYKISEHAAQDFLMTKYHKQTAESFLAECEEGNDQAIIKHIALKTNELITNVKSLATENEDGSFTTSLEELNERKLPPNMAPFLYKVALAEGMC